MAEILYRIHPSIGVARVGDAEDGFFIGPETPDLVPAGPRKKNGFVLRQAARFRVFAYERVEGRLQLRGEAREGEGEVLKVRWTVHLANRKAAFFAFDGLHGEPGRHHDGDDVPPLAPRNTPASDWEIDPGPRHIAGRDADAVAIDSSEGQWPDAIVNTAGIRTLGELRTDGDGRLLVLGGLGKAGSTQSPPAVLGHYANNPRWVDDVSDGPVTAEIVVREGDGERVVPVEDEGKAWCLVGPPDFAPEINSVVSLYDLLVNMAARSAEPLPDDLPEALGWLREIHDDFRTNDGKQLTAFRPDYTRDVFPILERALQYQWVHKQAASVHSTALADPTLADPSPDAAFAREEVFSRLRVPGAPSTSRQTMPRLLGDEPYDDHDFVRFRRRLALTPTQYAIMDRWQKGHFDAPDPVPVPGVHRPVAEDIMPWGLDRAALESCVGGAFYPGIEAGWQMRHPELFIAPFRVRHGAPSTYLTDTSVVSAGHFSRQMAVPWHADFMDCHVESHPDGSFGWWPSQRPDDVRKVPGGPLVSWIRGLPGNHEAMVANWAKLGFVLRDGTSPKFVERDRSDEIPG